MHDSEAELVSVVEVDDNPRRRPRELRLDFGLRNPFRRRQVRIVDRRQAPRQRSTEMADRGRRDDRPNPSSRTRRYVASPGGTVSVVYSSRREDPRVEYRSPHGPARYRQENHSESPAVEVLDSDDESPLPSGHRRRRHTVASDEEVQEVQESFERLATEVREAREDASHERYRRRQAERMAERARNVAYDERDRRHDAERRARVAQAREVQAEARRVEDARAVAWATKRARERRRQAEAEAGAERRRRLSQLYPTSSVLRHRPSFEQGADLRDELADPGARLILRAQQARRDQGRSRRHVERIIHDDDGYRGDFRWR